MSLARAFTTRRAKQPPTDMGILPQRSNTVARGHAHSGSIRNKISSPMELTHTTNMLAYNAPDLYLKSASSTSSSKSVSDDESESARTSTSSPPTSPDIPSVQDRAMSPEPNHLSCYFTVPGQKPPTTDSEAPAIPKRAPSHVKKTSYDQPSNKLPRFSHQSGTSVSTRASFSRSRSASISTASTSWSSGSLSRKRSIPSLPSTPSIPTSPPLTRSSPSFRRASERSEIQHPFGPELAQVTEIAEDYGVKDKLHIIDEEEQELISRGLCRLRPEDYLSEIQGLFSTFFRPEPTPAQEPVWI